MTNKLIEKRDVERCYGFRGTEAIIESEKYGKLLVMDGYGGENTMAGGAVRWRHGLAIKLKKEDTLDTLNDPFGDDGLSPIMRLIGGYGYEGRKILELEGKSLVLLASSVGII